ncbi:MAG: SRPBCC family protein [Gammaproteobacteria bacterium]
MTEQRITVLTRPSDRALQLTRSFDAPRGLVWSAWTDPAQLARWFGPDGFSITTHEHSIKPGGVWRFTMHGPDGRDYKNRVNFLEVNAPEKLVYKHAGEEEDDAVKFQTTVIFSETAGVTTLTMRMEFATAADLEFVIKNYGAEEGAMQNVARLAAHVDMLTSSQPEFLITRIFRAPRELVWQAWTDPAMLSKWFGPKGCSARIVNYELRPGGVWHSCLTMPDGNEMWGKFVYREVVPKQKLMWLHSFSNTEGDITRHPMSPNWPRVMLTTVIFEDAGKDTKITLSWTPYEATDIERQTFVDGMSGMAMGWGGSFTQLDAFLANA